MDILQEHFREILVEILCYIPFLYYSAQVNSFWYKATHKVPNRILYYYKGRPFYVGKNGTYSKFSRHDWPEVKRLDKQTISTFDSIHAFIKPILKSHDIDLVTHTIPGTRKHSFTFAFQWCILYVKEGKTPYLMAIWELFIEHFSFSAEIYRLLLALDDPFLIEKLPIFAGRGYVPDNRILAIRNNPDIGTPKKYVSEDFWWAMTTNLKTAKYIWKHHKDEIDAPEEKVIKKVIDTLISNRDVLLLRKIEAFLPSEVECFHWDAKHNPCVWFLKEKGLLHSKLTKKVRPKKYRIIHLDSPILEK